MNTALIKVDMQNDFGHPDGSLYVEGAEDIVDAVNSLEEYVDIVVATRCWHPAKTNHFLPEGPWPPHCVAETWGAEFMDGVNLSGDCIVFSKGTLKNEDAYSGFQALVLATRPRFFCVGLDEYLSEIDTLIVCGLATDYCVKATVLDGIERGYEVFVPNYAIAAVNVNPGDGNNALNEMESAGAYVIDRDDTLYVFETMKQFGQCD